MAKVIWEECEMCGDFACNLHHMHAADCSCPVIDVWAEADLCPYTDHVTGAVKTWVAKNPFEDEEDA